MLNKYPDHILLIEDVDRLSIDSQDEVFRILSSINSSLPKNSRLFYLVSYDK